MSGPFHSGEIELQRRSGVRDEARDLGRIIGRRIAPAVARLLTVQRLAVASSLDAGGRAWASLLTGPAGFIGAVDDEMVHIAARPIAGDPLLGNLAARPELGLLAIDPRTRLRLRFNGRGLVAEKGVFMLVDQTYGNCHKYIQRRALAADTATSATQPTGVADALSPGQRDWIARSDTFFIASFHPSGGADASHRGGFPGFVRVLDPRRLAFDDYPGNGMFNTLGNLVAYPATGLLFVDFESGDLLQLAGHAQVNEDFSVTYEIESVRETRAGSPLRWSFVEYSPANPGAAPSRPSAGGISNT